MQIVVNVRGFDVDHQNGVQFTLRGEGVEFAIVAPNDSEISRLLWDRYHTGESFEFTIGRAG